MTFPSLCCLLRSGRHGRHRRFRKRKQRLDLATVAALHTTFRHCPPTPSLDFASYRRCSYRPDSSVQRRPPVCHNAAMSKPFQISIRRMRAARARVCLAAWSFSVLMPHVDDNYWLSRDFLLLISFLFGGCRHWHGRWSRFQGCSGRLAVCSPALLVEPRVKS